MAAILLDTNVLSELMRPQGRLRPMILYPVGRDEMSESLDPITSPSPLNERSRIQVYNR